MHKVAIIILAEMEEHGDRGRVTNALEAVKEFKQHGDDVKLIFDGGGVTSAVASANPQHKMHRLYSQVEDKLAGVCRYCSRAFHVYEESRDLELPFLAESEQHPSIRDLFTQGYQVITF